MKMPARRPWSDRLERVLIRLVVAAAIIVMVAQALLTGNPVKEATAPVAAPDRQQPYLKNSAGILQSPVVTLQLKNYSTLPLARVLVNGESRGEFRDRYVTVFVREGDVLEVDGTRYNRPLDIEVLDVSREVVLPPAGTRIRVEGNISSLGQVRLSDR
jgi:hypothetical protein